MDPATVEPIVSAPNYLFGVSPGRWAQCIVIFISTMSASALALVGVQRQLKAQRETAKHVETLRFVTDQHNEDQFSNSYRDIIHIRKITEIEKYAQLEHRGSPQQQSIAYVLNRYEYMAVGLKEGILDEKMMKECSRGSVVRAYVMTRAYVHTVREATPTASTAYRSFLEIAESWFDEMVAEGRVPEEMKADMAKYPRQSKVDSGKKSAALFK